MGGKQSRHCSMGLVGIFVSCEKTPQKVLEKAVAGGN